MQRGEQSIERGELGLRELVELLWAGKLIIAVFAATFGALTVGYALFAMPMYRAEALVQIRDTSAGFSAMRLYAQFGRLAELGGFPGRGDDRALAVATLRSRAVIQSFIAESNLLPKLFADKWDEETREWKTDPEDQPTLWDGYRKFVREILRVAEDNKTGLAAISIDWSDPDEAAQWCTELIARTNSHLRGRAVEEGERSLAYLKEQINKTGLVELQQSAYSLMESELKKLMLAQGADEYALVTVDAAQPPERSERPKRVLIVAVGVFVGIILGMACVLFRHAMKG